MSRLRLACLLVCLLTSTLARASEQLKGKEAESLFSAIQTQMVARLFDMGYRDEARVLERVLKEASITGQTHTVEGERRGVKNPFGTTVKMVRWISEGTSLSNVASVRLTKIGNSRTARFTAQVSLNDGTNLTVASNRHKLEFSGHVMGKHLEGRTAGMLYEFGYNQHRPKGARKR